MSNKRNKHTQTHNDSNIMVGHVHWYSVNVCLCAYVCVCVWYYYYYYLSIHVKLYGMYLMLFGVWKMCCCIFCFSFINDFIVVAARQAGILCGRMSSCYIILMFKYFPYKQHVACFFFCIFLSFSVGMSF